MRRMILAGVAALMMAGAPMAAHHSYSAFHNDRIVELEGVVEAFEWITPHSLLKVRTTAALYTLEGPAPARFQRYGIERDALKTGDRVVVTGNPRRDIDESGVTNLKSIRRPSDGWSWP